MAPPPPESARPGLGRDGIRRWALGLLVAAAIPDVLPYAGLASLVGERFQKSDAEVQLFAVAALMGALLAVPLIRRVRDSSPRRVFAVAALVQAFAIALMALPVSWELLLLLRGLQGGADLLTLVTLTTVVASHARGTGRGFGASGSAIFCGLAAGLVGGGLLAASYPLIVFPLSAAISLLLALAAFGLPALHVAARQVRATRIFDRRILFGGAFAASDRMIPGMVTVSLPLLLVATMDASPTVIGIVLGAPLLACAMGGYASGILIDRIGGVSGRLIGVPLQGLGLSLVVLSEGVLSVLLIGTLLMALGAMILLPTSLVLGTGRRTDQIEVDAVGGIQAIGQGGHLAGVSVGFILTAVAGEVTTWGVLGVVLFYLAWNAGFLWRLVRDDAALPRPGPQFERASRQPIGPLPSRVARTRSGSLIDPPSSSYDEGPSGEEPGKVDQSCPSTNMNASRTARS